MAIDSIDQIEHNDSNNSNIDNSDNVGDENSQMNDNPPRKSPQNSSKTNGLTPQTKVVDPLYANLRKVYKSRPQSEKEAKCQIKFVNCTSHKVVIYWVDFKGRLIEYARFSKLGDFVDVNTYVSHLWIFRSGEDNPQSIQLLAVPEDILDTSKQDQQVGQTNEASWILENLRCHHCRTLEHGRSCPHMTGNAKFSISDDHPSISSTNIYRCSVKNHEQEHSRHRRNIYLVEPFLSLRERCFVALRNQLKENSDMFNIELPTSLKRDYFEFIVLPEETGHKRCNISTHLS